MEKEVEVKTVKVRYVCDDCGTEVRFAGSVYPTSRPKYGHFCPNCKKEYMFYEQYPYLKYIEGDGDE